MSKKILVLIGAIALVMGLGIAANAAWGPYQFVWPNATTIQGPLAVSNSVGSGFTVTTGVAAGTTTLDLSAANTFRVLMPAGNTTVAFSNILPGEQFTISIQQDSVGSRTVTWPSTIKWSGSSAPTLTTTANKTDTFSFYADANGNQYEMAPLSTNE